MNLSATTRFISSNAFRRRKALLLSTKNICTTQSFFHQSYLPATTTTTSITIPNTKNINCHFFESKTELSSLSSVLTLANQNQQKRQHQQQNRFFHKSNVTLAVRRRRRRNSGLGEPSADTDDEDGSTQSKEENIRHVFITDKEQFVKKSTEFLNKIEQSIQHMPQCNDIFIIKRLSTSKLQIELSPLYGSYYFDLDVNTCRLYYQSPISGKYTYIYSDTSQDFIAEDDEHSVSGIFVRDIIRQCNGYPKL